ncbi:MAG: hydantoinase B/oxoprolinase family protein, partial [Alphaproteobacteria bacterium]
MAEIDPIDRDVFQHQLAGIAEEMSMALRRAAFSSIIWDMYDYACGLFTPEGEM